MKLVGNIEHILALLQEVFSLTETCGRLCVFVTPRSASKRATGLDLIEVPRSVWSVSCPGWMCCFLQLSSISRLANSALSIHE